MTAPKTFKEWFDLLPEDHKKKYRIMRREQMKQKRDQTRVRKFTSRLKEGSQ